MTEQPMSPAAEAAAVPRRPLVFISHDTRDADLAEAFENLLSDASGGMLRSFRSSDRKGTSGIEFGADWYATIMSKLADATDVVALLTPNSLERPWILYEVGVARGKRSTPAFGLVLGLDLSAISGPFAQFQNSASDEDSVTTLVLQLIRRNPDAQPREQAIRRHVAAFREQLAPLIEEAASATEEPEAVSAAKFYEEIKAMIRDLGRQITVRADRTHPPVRQHLVRDEEWVARGREIIAALYTAPIDDRHNRWDDLISHLLAKMPTPPVGMMDVWRGAFHRKEPELRDAALKLEAVAEEIERGANSDLERDVAGMLRLALDAVSVWRGRPSQLAEPTKRTSR